MEVRNFFKKTDVKKVSGQAFSKSRDKLDPEVFKVLNNFHLKNFYQSDEVKKFKNHLILGGDGSKFTLPYKFNMIPMYGGIENKFHDITSIAINTTTVYDCLNKLCDRFRVRPL